MNVSSVLSRAFPAVVFVCTSFVFCRERTIWARTDTIRVFKYMQRPIPIREILALSAPATYIIIPGRWFTERSYFTQWMAHSIQG